MRGMKEAAALALGVCLLLSGCRSTRPELQTWDERGDDEAAPPPASTQPKLVTAQEAAKSAQSARHCANFALAQAQQDLERGWTMLNACAGREDFTLLEILVEEPWLTKVKSTASATLVARVIANRGGDVYGDLKALQGRQVPLWTLEQALEQPQKRAGSTLLVRGELAEIAPADAGVTLKIVETSWRTLAAASDDDDTVMESDDGDADPGGTSLHDGAKPTGRTLFVSAGKLDPTVKQGEEWLLVVVFNSAEKCQGSEGDALLCGTAKLISIGKPAAKLRDNW
ncbi:MAG: hypothetical protein JXR83_17860 [Deltaproteobacteria bacterium]|nr:hypothetical protein [Deltaproteobacteria bacterium]